MMGKLAYLGNSIRLSHWFAVLFSMGRHISRHFYKLQAQRTANVRQKRFINHLTVRLSFIYPLTPSFQSHLGKEHCRKHAVPGMPCSTGTLN